MKISITASFLLISSISLAADPCFEVVPNEKLTSLTCGQVSVHVYKSDCKTANTRKDLGLKTGQVNCQGSKTIVTKLPDYILTSTLKINTLWGDNSLSVNTTSAKAIEQPKKRSVANKAAKISEIAAPPPPVMIVQEEKKVEAPTDQLNFKFSGFASVEIESSRNFGYTIPGSYNDSFLFSNAQFEISKESTQATYLLEINETFAGDSQTGGQQGGRTTPVKNRNLFLTQTVSSATNFKIGLQALSSDPNAYIISDNYSALVVNQQISSGTVSMWTAQAQQDKPGVDTASATHVNPDSYLGLKYQISGTDWDLNLYGTQRSFTESLYDAAASAVVVGKSKVYWLGFTGGSKLSEDLKWQASAISNTGSFKSDTNNASDKYSASLFDLKLIYAFSETGFELQLEGLQTTGSNDSVDAGQSVQTLGKRQNFSSPIGAAYLMTIATSDGADDAPGSTKQSVIGNLSQAEGVSVGVLKLSKTVGDSTSVFARAGVLRSTSKHSVNDSSDMGSEWDIGMTHSLSKSTSLQFDYGKFMPGAFFTNRDAAELFTSRLKFGF